MRKGNIFSLLFFLATLIFLIIACSKSNKQTEESNTTQEDVVNKMEKNNPIIPSLSTLYKETIITGTTFNPKLANGIEAYNNYISSPNKGGLNLGVYSTDIIYLSKYNQASLALNFMDGIMKLIDKMSFSDAIDLASIERFENNLQHSDTLVSIIEETMAHNQNYLIGTERAKVALLVYVGSLIENNYLIMQSLKPFQELNTLTEQQSIEAILLLTTLSKQKAFINDAMNALNEFEYDDEWTKNIIESLVKFNKTVSIFNIESEIENNNLIQIINDATFQSVGEQISNIRNEIVSF